MAYGFMITVEGRKLLAKLVAGSQLEITRVMVGSGDVEEGQSPAYFTDLVQPVAQATSTLPVAKEDTVSFVVEYRSDLNGGLEEGFWLKEFGVFARDGEEEILLYYATLGDFPQYVTAYKKGAVDIRRYPVSIMLTDGVDLILEYPAIAFITEERVKEILEQQELPKIEEKIETALQEHTENETAHKALFDSKAAQVHKHSAADITSGILPMDKGGTGAAAASAALSNLGGFPKTGGTISGDTTIQGNLRLQNKSLNYNTKINFGDADYVYIREYTDNNMEIKANNVNFVVSGNVTQNNKKIGAATQEEIEALFSVFAKNMALGYNALKENTSGICNIALGHSALEKNTTGKYNVALGLTTLNANTSGFNNVAIGQNALKANTSSSNNVAIGYNTLNNNTSGSNNVAIGYNALNGLTSYSFCTGLGYNTQVTGSNQVQLGDVTATVYAQKAVVTRSDARDKADIADSDLGLDFILRLKQ